MKDWPWVASTLLLLRSRRLVACQAVGTDLRDFGRRRFRHPDRFTAIRASLPIRRHCWPRAVGNPKAQNPYFLFDDIRHPTAPGQCDVLPPPLTMRSAGPTL